MNRESRIQVLVDGIRETLREENGMKLKLTVRELRKAIEDCPDDMYVWLDGDHEYAQSASIGQAEFGNGPRALLLEG